jgi:hypothetical protein
MFKLSDVTKRWRVTYEEGMSGRAKGTLKTDLPQYEEIRGRHGSIYLFDENHLAVMAEKPQILIRLYALLGFPEGSYDSPNPRSSVDGVEQFNAFVFLFPVALLDSVAQVIKAKRVIQLSDTERSKRRKRALKARKAIGTQIPLKRAA